MPLMQFFVAFILVFALPGGCARTPLPTSSTEIIWQPGTRLQWDDFRSRTGASGLYKAYTTAGIRYAIDAPEGKVRIRTEAYFLKEESWVHVDHKVATLLRHEQGHFDIAGVFALRLAKALQHLEVSAEEFMQKHLNERAEELFQAIYAELDATQQRYDQETVHGTNTEAQTQWEAWILEELNK